MKRPVLALSALLIGAGVATAEPTPAGKVQFEEGAVKASLTGQAGDVANGRKVFKNRKLGNCLACHANSDMKDELFHGEVGPTLDGVSDRWTEAELRGIVTNSKKTFEGSIMPSFYVVDGIGRPLKKFAGKSILSGQQVEDVVAYLMTLKEQ
ncbi:sulfur oxidation c-type cytochrome SoxX [Cohaesibacter gelatinilyticus]|uniref:Sulfur-oxidizing protein SoxX n=1 Tax=Cohaesibacter gelatinilyticus TaxID=372072 RepID=A0A285PI84_9HYPH|nr:sulfur oxidation c-type cytochrome SoxX [Cohaesibacter gelatinilyticus]SNZ20983.1 sulfur-oxidizing protein SoxX [Cohaesibacter gelatinilyticus]HAT86112.1 sulfur oxidation c-type cytochrome SoxX [Hyphomicrobiales bacterium]